MGHPKVKGTGCVTLIEHTASYSSSFVIVKPRMYRVQPEDGSVTALFPIQSNCFPSCCRLVGVGADFQ